MSFCRWSSDDFDCDLYIYEGTSGYDVHVAGSRHQFDRDVLGPPVVPADGDAWIARHLALRVALESAPLVPIGLSRDGESYTLDTADEAADLVEDLIAEGYHVPGGVVEALREEEGL